MTTHDPITQTLTISAITPATPLVLCDAGFLNTLAQVELAVARINVTDATTAQAASDLLQRLTTAGTKLEKARTDLKAPFIAKGREIDTAASAPNSRIESAKRAIKHKVAQFDLEQQRLAREAEEARLAELRRLEAIRVEEERQAREKAEALARQAEAARLAAEAAIAAGKPAVVDMDFDDGPPAPANATIEYGPPKTATELAIEKVRFAPAAPAAKPAGVAFRTTLVIESIDVSKLPDVFVTKQANERAIRATFCQGYRDGDPVPECAGVVFRVSREVASTGRAVF